MPYKAFKKNGKFMVFKLDADGKPTGKALGTHEDEESAKKQVKALYASENKEISEDDLVKMMGEMPMGEMPMMREVPMMGGPTSFSEMDAMEEAREKVDTIQKMAYAFPDMAMTIMRRHDIENKEQALSNLGKEFADRCQGMMKKELDEKAKWSAAFMNDLPDSSFLYISPGGEKDEEGKTKPRTLRYFPYKDASGKIDLPHLRNAIQRIPQANIPADKKASLQAKAKKLLETQNKESNSWLTDFVDFVKSLFTKEEEAQEQTFFLWKETDGYRWLARYSNNFIDEDNPPDIISEVSHKRFVDLVDKGLTPLPELWLWHVPEWRWGQATSVAYDDSGFALAMGKVNKGCEPIAEWVMSQKGMGASHGMPRESIKRDDVDKRVITEHITREISPLFADKAANKRADFFIIPKETNMAIPEQKKAELIAAGLSSQVLEALEAKNASDAKEAKSSGVINKETEGVTSPEAPKVETSAQEQPLTAEAIVMAINAAFKPLADKLAVVETELKELKKDDEAKIAEKAMNVPKASLEAMVQEKLFGPATQVDGRSALVKSGPKVTEEQKPQGLFFEQWLPGNQEVRR